MNVRHSYPTRRSYADRSCPRPDKLRQLPSTPGRDDRQIPPFTDPISLVVVRVS
jgi:hypothetical protein